MNEIYTRLKILMLYPFAKLGYLKAQLKIADFLFNDYWYLSPKNPEKWLKKGLRKNNPFAIVLNGHFKRYKARNLMDEQTAEAKLLYLEYDKLEENPDYVIDQKIIDDNRKASEEQEEKIEALLFEALNCYKKASDMNNAMGQFNVYQMYDSYSNYLELKGNGTKYLVLAAKNNLPNAMGILAQKCIERDDLKQGLYWMEKACKAKKRDWVKDEGFCCERNDVLKRYKKIKNIIQVKKAAMAGDPKALYDYSRYLEEDSHKNDSLKLFHLWHLKASEAGYPLAMGQEGYFIIHGWVPGTLEDALNYFKKSYDGGIKEAAQGIADCYYYGWGTEQNAELAKFYYKIAKKAGCRIDLKCLKEITQENIREKVDGKKALENDREFYN